MTSTFETGKGRRVVITGMGLLTPVGDDVSTSWAALLQGKSGGGPITNFEVTEEYTTRIACEVKNFDPSGFLDPKEVRRFDWFAQFGLGVAIGAMASKGLDGAPSGLAAAGLCVFVGRGVVVSARVERACVTRLSPGGWRGCL